MKEEAYANAAENRRVSAPAGVLLVRHPYPNSSCATWSCGAALRSTAIHREPDDSNRRVADATLRVRCRAHRLFLGFSAAMLGISGFESSANYIEQEQLRVFLKKNQPKLCIKLA